MLHPTLYLDGVVDDISNWEALTHFISIGWKFTAALVPPPHLLRGWPAFLASLVIIGFQMLLVLEYTKLFACATGFGTYLTAITIIAIALAIPEAFATWRAAGHSKYADNALMGHQCSVSVNVHLGIGFSWMVVSIYALANGGGG